MPLDPTHPRPRIVVLGAGFGGLQVVRRLARTKADVTLVDARNHHLFQPLLYQVATAALSPSDIAVPIRRIVARQKNVRVVLARALEVDRARRRVRLESGSVEYDWLVVAVGSRSTWYGHEAEWARHAPSLKNLGDALEIRRRVLGAFEAAEAEPDPARRQRLLTFVVVGGGPTGVELAGALAELARRTLRGEFRSIDPARARVLLVEALDRPLPTFAPESSAATRRALEALGVQVLTGRHVGRVDADGIVVGTERVDAATMVWAAGIEASPLLGSLGAPRAPDGRLRVGPDLRVTGCEDVFAIGDAAAFEQDGRLLPAMAPPAIQEGRHVARNLRRLLAGRGLRPFRYRDRGALATIGRSRAVAEIRGFRSTGRLAWWLWVVVHVTYLIGFRNRFAVLFEWAWAYATGQRSARIIPEPPLGGERPR